MQPPASHTPTLKVLREFFISATFSSMAQRQLLTFSSKAYSPCWIRDSSCIASVKPAFNSEANACNWRNHKHSGTASRPRRRWLCPQESPLVQTGMKARCIPSCKVLCSFSSFHGWEAWGGGLVPAAAAVHGRKCLRWAINVPLFGPRVFPGSLARLQPVSLQKEGTA